MPISLMDFSSDMAVRRARTPRMATLRTILIFACQSRHEVFRNLSYALLLFIYLFLFLKQCPTGRESSILRAVVFPRLFPQLARCGCFILWMLVGSLPGLVFLYLFHRLFLVCTFVVVELVCSLNARPPVSTQ